MTPPASAAFARLHDELMLEATTALRDALSRLEASRRDEPEALAAARHEAIELAVVALELLHRAELAAVGVHETAR
jgi:hypothetical protein